MPEKVVLNQRRPQSSPRGRSFVTSARGRTADFAPPASAETAQEGRVELRALRRINAGEVLGVNYMDEAFLLQPGHGLSMTESSCFFFVFSMSRHGTCMHLPLGSLG